MACSTEPALSNSVDFLLKNAFDGLKLEDKLVIKQLGPDRPDVSITQKTKDKWKIYTTEHFHEHGMMKMKWLCGCSVRNTVFCFPCLLFRSCLGQGDIGITGVSDVKYFSEVAKKHTQAKHIYSVL